MFQQCDTIEKKVAFPSIYKHHTNDEMREMRNHTQHTFWLAEETVYDRNNTSYFASTI